jgi:lipopolysaccharide heptosyltransferase I
VTPDSILIIKTSSLGDIVCALPVLTQLRRLYPSAHIAWVADHRFADLLAGHPLLDEVLVFRRHRVSLRAGAPAALRGFIGERRRLAERLRERRWDVALDLQSLLKSTFILRASRAPVRVADVSGLRHLPCLLGANRFVRARAVHAVPRCLEIAAPLGVRPDAVEFGLAPTAEARAWAEARLGGMPGPVLAVNPGSAMPAKRWPPERFAEAAREALAGGLVGAVVITGGRDDHAAAEVIRQACAGCGAVASLAGQTSLPQLVGVLACADAMLTGDTGPMHIMAALGRPVVALFGPTPPERHGPWGEGHAVLRAPNRRVASISADQAVAALAGVLRRAR